MLVADRASLLGTDRTLLLVLWEQERMRLCLKMNLFGKMAMRPNWLTHKLETLAILHYPNSGIFWVVHHIHVDHMDRSFVFSFSLREVFQCLIINL